MLARQHANLGVIGTIGAAQGLSAIGGAHLPMLSAQIDAQLIALTQPVALAIITIIGAAFAIVPDFDTPNSIVSRKFGFVGEALSGVFGSLMGGHRKGSHTLWFALACGLIGFLIQLIPFQIPIASAGITLSSGQLFTGIIFVLSVMLIIKLILPMGIGKQYYGILIIAAVILTSVFAFQNQIPTFGLAFAMFIGVTLHCLGDFLTPSGIPFLYPIRTKFALNLNGVTGHERELYVTQPIFIMGAAALIIFTIIMPGATDIGHSSTVAALINH